MRIFDYHDNNATYSNQNTVPFPRCKKVKKQQDLRSLGEANKYVRLDIKLETLTALIAQKTLAIGDLRGLDGKTKSLIKELLLNSLLSDSTRKVTCV